MKAPYAIRVTARLINETLHSHFSDNLHCALLEPLHKLRLESAADTLPHSFTNVFGRRTAELFPFSLSGSQGKSDESKAKSVIYYRSLELSVIVGEQLTRDRLTAASRGRKHCE